MRNYYTWSCTLFIFMLLTAKLHTQEMGFEEYNPISTLVVPEHPVERAKYPFVDVHSHHFNMPEQDLSVLVSAMDSLNMGVMVNLSGRSGEHLKQAIANVRQNYPNRFLIFANVDFSGVGSQGWGQAAAAQLETDVRNGAAGLKIYKSLGLRNRDVRGNRIPVDDPRLDPIWTKCAELGIPVLIHSADPKSFWDPMDANNERWLELKLRPRRKRGDTDPAPWKQIIEEQHRMFKKHPNTTFINAHMGWFANNLAQLGSYMDEMPNMYVGIGAVIAELGRQPRQARWFFERYQNRILFGKDAWNPSEYPTYFRVLETADEYFPYYKKYHAFWAMYGLDLPDKILRKVYYENALNILKGIDPSLFPQAGN
jgi:predicted TIM-barrel fold metal-dependent hydrolase